MISELSKVKTPLRVEIEDTDHRFYSKFLLRSGAVVLKYPQRLKDQLAEDRRLRIELPESPEDSLCLLISSARYGGAGEMATELGQMTVVCKIPSATVEKTKRAAIRYFTGRFNDIVLILASQAGKFPVVNLSTSGLRLLLKSEEQQQLFSLGAYLGEAGIQLGKMARVKLIDAIPRCHFADGVGIEMVVDPAGISKKTLEYFVEKLADEEQKLDAVVDDEKARSS